MAILPDYTALHMAVVSHDRDGITKLLIENGADLNVINDDSLTPLELAIDTGSPFEFDPILPNKFSLEISTSSPCFIKIKGMK